MKTEELTQLNREWSPGRETGPDDRHISVIGAIQEKELADKGKVQWIDDLGKVVHHG